MLDVDFDEETVTLPDLHRLKRIKEDKDFSEANLDWILGKFFGFAAFREGQLGSILCILEKRSCLTILPTGKGKSLIYQVPALLLGGLTLVVSPLISLMVDQIEHIPAALRACTLNSS